MSVRAQSQSGWFRLRWREIVDDDDVVCDPQFMPPRRRTLTSRPMPVTMTKTETRIWETCTVLSGWKIQTWWETLNINIIKWHESKTQTRRHSSGAVALFRCERESSHCSSSGTFSTAIKSSSGFFYTSLKGVCGIHTPADTWTDLSLWNSPSISQPFTERFISRSKQMCFISNKLHPHPGGAWIQSRSWETWAGSRNEIQS